jgi:hypothetical protein
VHEVLGHMTATATITPLGFFSRMARAGFRLETMTRRNIDAQTADATLARFRAAHNRSSGHPARSTPGWARPSCTPKTSAAH